jgi:hypothetical protein
MGVSGQRHAPAALLPSGKGSPVPIVQEAGWAPEPVWTQEDRGKILCPCRGSNPNRPVVQPVVRHYTAWATPAPILPAESFLTSRQPFRHRPLWNQKLMYRVHYSTTLDHILSHLNPVHNLKIYILRCILILSSHYYVYISGVISLRVFD